MAIFLIQIQKFIEATSYRHSKWPLMLSLLLGFMIFYNLYQMYNKKKSWNSIIFSAEQRNSILLLIACLTVSGLLFFYKILTFLLVGLILFAVYNLYKKLSPNSSTSLENKIKLNIKHVLLLAYSLIVLLLFTKIGSGSVTITFFLFMTFVFSSILIRFWTLNKFQLDKSLLHNKTSKEVITFISIMILINGIQFYNILGFFFAKIYGESTLNGSQYGLARDTFINIFVFLLGIICLLNSISWFYYTLISERNPGKSNHFFRNTILSFSFFTFFLFYFGDFGYYTFTTRLKQNKSKSSISISTGDEDLDGRYTYSGSNYSFKVESTVYINGNKWSASYFEKDSFGQIQESASNSGYIKDKKLFDENGYELGYISGRRVNMQLYGRYISHSK
jgi:hypothetical protein